MSRFYLRMMLKYFEKIVYYFKTCTNIPQGLIKSLTYKQKIRNVIAKSKNKLYRDIETINSTNQYQTAQIINKVR